MSYSREDIIASARSYLGVRFKIKGRSSHDGMDCVGLLWNISRDIGQNAPDDQTYTRYPNSTQFLRNLYANTVEGSPRALGNGSIGLFRQAAYPLHCGIITVDQGRIQVINANLVNRAVVEQPWAAWVNLLIGVREFPGVV